MNRNTKFLPKILKMDSCCNDSEIKFKIKNRNKIYCHDVSLRKTLLKKIELTDKFFKHYKTERKEKEKTKTFRNDIKQKNKFILLKKKMIKQEQNKQIDFEYLKNQSYKLFLFLTKLKTIDDFQNDLIYIKKIGEGFSSEVYSALSKSTKRRFILKSVKIDFLIKERHLLMIKV